MSAAKLAGPTLVTLRNSGIGSLDVQQIQTPAPLLSFVAGSWLQPLLSFARPLPATGQISADLTGSRVAAALHHQLHDRLANCAQLVGQASSDQVIRVLRVGGDPVDLTFSFPVGPSNNPFLLQPGLCSHPINSPSAVECKLIWRFAPSSPAGTGGPGQAPGQRGGKQP